MVDLFGGDDGDDTDTFDLDLGGGPLAQQNDQIDLSNEPLTPLTNSRLFGQESTEAYLVDFINKNRLPHTLIFVGPEGVGKATMAYRLARTLLAHGAQPESSGPSLFGDPEPAATKLVDLNVDPKHPAATRLASGAHPDFLLIGGDNTETKSGNILVDEARKVPGFLSLRPSVDGGWRVVIIDNAHRLNNNAQNALLKVLEEPPPRTLMILIVHQIGSLLPTIRSRSHDVHFNALSNADFDQCLKHLGYHLSQDDFKWVAALSNGCPGQVAKILDIDGIAIIKSFLALWQNWPNVDEGAWLLFTENLTLPAEKDAYRFILDFWQWWAGAMLRAKADPVRLERLLALTQSPETGQMINHFSLADWIEICDKLRIHMGRTLSASLEQRQALYSARMLMIPGSGI